MRISYRQGLIAASSGFLVNSQTPNYVDLFIDNSPIIASIAFGDRDYLISEEQSVSNAWGPLSNAPTQYLYWELNAYTGELNRGVTDYAPVTSSIAPVNPPVGLMWWNTSINKMSVWTGAKWKEVYRVLAGSVINGSVIQEPFTSQVGLNTPSEAGYILTDGYGSTFRDANGNLFTTITTSFQNDTGSLVKLQESVILVQANENIPKFSFVYLLDGRAALASNSSDNDYAKAPIAMVTEDAYQNSQCQLHMFGRQVFNQDWNFSAAEIGQSVYCDASGALTLTKPLTQQFVRCGIILSSQSIYLSFDTHYLTNPGGGEISPGSLIAAHPLTILSSGQNYEISIAQASNSEDGYIDSADFARIGALETEVSTKAPLTHNWPQSQVIGLSTALNGKANLVHTHAQSDITNLVTDLAAKAELVHTHEISSVTGLTAALNSINAGINSKVTAVTTATPGNLVAFSNAGQVADSGLQLAEVATLSTNWPISSITNLSNQLSTLAPLTTVWPQSQVAGLTAELQTITTKMDKIPSATFGNFASFDSTGSVVDSGFSNNSFALANATWNISSVNGLQSALDGKAAVVHTHTINDTTGLQSALDSKLNTNATLPISQIVGLQSALNAKVGKIGDTMTGDLTAPNIFVGTTALNQDGSISVSGTKGQVGQVLKSNGNAPAEWFDLPVISAPAGQLVLGTGTGITGTDVITYQELSGNPTIVVTGDFKSTGVANMAASVVDGFMVVNGTLAVGGGLAFDMQVGNPGQVLQSNGADTPSWVDLPEVVVPSSPDKQVVYGTGTGLSSSSEFTFDSTTNVLAIGGNTSLSNGSISTTNFSGDALTLSGLANVNSAQTVSLTVTGDAIVDQSITANDVIVNDELSADTLSVTNSSTLNTVIADNLTVTTGITSQTITVAGASTLADVTVNSLTSTIDINVGGALTVTGALNANTTNVTDLTASGNIEANGIVANGEMSADSLVITTDVTAGELISTSNISAVGNISASNATLTNALNTVDINATGNISGTELILSGNAQITGDIFVDDIEAQNISALATIDTVDLTVTGQLTAASVVISDSIGLNDGFQIREGLAGQVLSSSGPGAVPAWIDLPPAGDIIPSIVAGQVVIGTGTSIEGQTTLIISNDGISDVVEIDGKITVSDDATFSGPTVTVANDLEVGGIVNLLGNFNIAGISGTEGQVITIDGAGDLIWADINFPVTSYADTLIPFGTGTGVSTAASLAFNSSTETLIVTNVSSTEVAADTGIFSSVELNGSVKDSLGETGVAGQYLVSTGTAVEWADLPTPRVPDYFEVDSVDIDDAKTNTIDLVITVPFAISSKDTINNKSNTQVFIDGLLVREGVKYTISGSDITIPHANFNIGSEITIFAI